MNNNSLAQNSSAHPASAGQVHSKIDENFIDVKALWRTLMRRKWVIINTVSFIAILSILVLVQLTPRYTATSTLAVQSRQNNVVNLEAVMSGMGTDVAAIKTEIDVLKSRRLVGRMVDDLQLVKDAEFNNELVQDHGFLSSINPVNYIPKGWSQALFGIEEVLSEEAAAAITRSQVIDAVMTRYSVSNPALSYTIHLSFESESPEKAAKMANSLANLYLLDQLEFKFEATQRASEWLNERVSDLRENVRQSENAVQKYREENQLFQTGSDGLVSDQQLTRINISLIEARTDLAKVEARYHQVDNLTSRGVQLSALAEVLDSPIIQRLKEQESKVTRNRAELATRYGPKHPRMLNAEAELKDINSKIELEVQKVVKGIETEVQVAKSRVSSLENSLQSLKTENVVANRAIVKLRELQREAESGRVLLETFLSRFKETSSQEDLQQADARIISLAYAPLQPSYPKKRLILVLIVFAAGGLGVGLVFLLESLDNGYRTMDQIKADFGVRGLGLLPFLSSEKGGEAKPENYIIEKPTSSFAEAHRNVHAALMFGEDGHLPPKVVQVTSSVPGEGKSTFALGLIRLLAKSGVKVLLVEADLRRPTLLRRMKIPAELPTYTQCLAENKPLANAMYKDAVSGAYLMAGSQQSDPQRMLKHERLAQFIGEARDHFDLIVVDTPPILAVSDVIVTSDFVDETIYVVRWEQTTKEAVKSGMGQLKQTGVRIAGSVVSQVNLTKHVGYGYGDYGYYYGVHKEYYSN